MAITWFEPDDPNDPQRQACEALWDSARLKDPLLERARELMEQAVDALEGDAEPTAVLAELRDALRRLTATEES